MSGVEIPLSKPIMAHGKELTALVLREPSSKDEIELGQPFFIIVDNGGQGIKIQLAVVAQYIVRLAGIPLSSVHALERADFSKAQAAVMGFFGTDEGGRPSS